MKRFLFDFLTFEDRYINGGNLFTKTVLLELIKNDVEVYGICKNYNQLNDSIKELAKENNIKIYTCVEDVEETNKIIKEEQITDFFIGVSQRYNHIDITKLNCDIYIICHDIGDLVVNSAELETRKYWRLNTNDFWHKEVLGKARKGNFFRKFIAKIKQAIKNTINLFHEVDFAKKRNNEFYYNFTRLIQQKNVHVITVSEYSKHAIEYYFEDIANEIFVSYPPFFYREKGEVSEEFKNKLKGKEYFLLLNVDRANKNANVFLKTYPKLKVRYNKRFSVVLVGNKEPIIDDGIINISRASDAELEYLMANAYCLIYPSVSEGFGMPPVEVMSYGTPVIAAFDTSIPEACRDGALYFNPLYVEDLFYKIVIMERNRDEYINRSQTAFNVIKNKMDNDFKELIKYILG